MAFYGRERHGGERMVRGVRASLPRRGWHGDVRGRRQAGEGGTRPCLGRARNGVAHAGAVGRLGGVLVGRGGRGACVRACSVLDSGPGRQITGDCGQGRGPWCYGLAWGVSGRQGLRPGHGGAVDCRGLGASGHGSGMSMAWHA